MAKTHQYKVTVEWTGNTGSGTSGYKAYERRHEISAGTKKPPIPGSSDPNFRGDAARWNPEELLVASLSECGEKATTDALVALADERLYEAKATGRNRVC